MVSKNRLVIWHWIGMLWHQVKIDSDNLTHILGHSVFTQALDVEVGKNPDGMNNVAD